MGVSKEFEAYVREKFEILGEIDFARFFGGVGASYNGVQFAMLMDGCVYFCVDDGNRNDYLEAGMQPFSYQTKKGTILVSKYYALPEDALENPSELRTWAQGAIRAAHATSSKKAGKPARKRTGKAAV